MKKRVLASFSDDRRVLAALERLRSSGFAVEDVYGPYPIHGIEKSMGLPPSWLPKLTFILGSGAAAFAFLFQAWVSTVDWPLRIGGKPFYAWPSFLPIVFESAVLISGLGTVAAFLIDRRLLPWNAERSVLSRVTDDRFVIAVDGRAPGFDRAGLNALLAECGAESVSEAAS